MFPKRKVHHGPVETIQISGDLQADIHVRDAPKDLPIMNNGSIPSAESFYNFFHHTKLEDWILVVLLMSLLLIIIYVGYRTQKWWIHTLQMVEKHQQHSITLQEHLTELKEEDCAHRKEIELLKEQLNESIQRNMTWTISQAANSESSNQMNALIEQRRIDAEEILGLKKILANLKMVHTKLLKQHYQSNDSQAQIETNHSLSTAASSSSVVGFQPNENTVNDDDVEGISDDLANEARISALEAQVIEDEQEILRLRALLAAAEASITIQRKHDFPIIDPNIQIDDDRILIAALRRELHRCQDSSDKKDEMIASLQLQRLAIRKELAELRLNGKGMLREGGPHGTIPTTVSNDDDDDDEELGEDENDGSSEFYVSLGNHHHQHRESGIECDNKTDTTAMISVSSVAASLPRTKASTTYTTATTEGLSTTMILEHDMTTIINEIEEVEFLYGLSSSHRNGSNSNGTMYSSTMTAFRNCSSPNLLSSLSSTSEVITDGGGSLMIDQMNPSTDLSSHLVALSSSTSSSSSSSLSSTSSTSSTSSSSSSSTSSTSHALESTSPNVSPSRRKHHDHDHHHHHHHHRHRPGSSPTMLPNTSLSIGNVYIDVNDVPVRPPMQIGVAREHYKCMSQIGTSPSVGNTIVNVSDNVIIPDGNLTHNATDTMNNDMSTKSINSNSNNTTTCNTTTSTLNSSYRKQERSQFIIPPRPPSEIGNDTKSNSNHSWLSFFG